MSSTKPYLIRAIHEWCSDEGLTPYLAVQVNAETQVPHEFVRDGQIVLNVSNDATHQLSLGNDEITFQTRFNGAKFPVVVPVNAVVAIYAKENGQGMAFEPTANTSENEHEIVGAGDTAPETNNAVDTQEEATTGTPARRGGHLTRIK